MIHGIIAPVPPFIAADFLLMDSHPEAKEGKTNNHQLVNGSITIFTITANRITINGFTD